MALDVKKQLGITEPTRDWFPLSLMGAFADFADVVHGLPTLRAFNRSRAQAEQIAGQCLGVTVEKGVRKADRLARGGGANGQVGHGKQCLSRRKRA